MSCLYSIYTCKYHQRREVLEGTVKSCTVAIKTYSVMITRFIVIIHWRMHLPNIVVILVTSVCLPYQWRTIHRIKFDEICFVVAKGVSYQFVPHLLLNLIGWWVIRCTLIFSFHVKNLLLVARPFVVHCGLVNFFRCKTTNRYVQRTISFRKKLIGLTHYISIKTLNVGFLGLLLSKINDLIWRNDSNMINR